MKKDKVLKEGTEPSKPLRVNPPPRIPLILRPVIKKTEKITGKRMEVARIMSWSFLVSLAAGILEWAMEKAAQKHSTPRRVKLVRIQVSLSAVCPFCIDMNGFQYEKDGITTQEARSLQLRNWQEVDSFSQAEKNLLLWVDQMTRTPIQVDPELLPRLLKDFSQIELVVLGGLSAKVGFWTHFIQAMQIPPAGYGGLQDVNLPSTPNRE